MSRLALLAALGIALGVWGCATEQTQLPAGEDPDQLAAAIAARSCGEGPPVPEPPAESAVLTNCAKVVVVAGAVCLAIPVVLVYIFLKAKTNAMPTPAL